MVKCHLSRILGERKLKVAEVARDTGINRNTLHRLYNETTTRIELDVIEVLCQYLDVGIGDLFDQLEVIAPGRITRPVNFSNKISQYKIGSRRINKEQLIELCSRKTVNQRLDSVRRRWGHAYSVGQSTQTRCCEVALP